MLINLLKIENLKIRLLLILNLNYFSELSFNLSNTFFLFKVLIINSNSLASIKKIFNCEKDIIFKIFPNKLFYYKIHLWYAYKVLKIKFKIYLYKLFKKNFNISFNYLKMNI